jgi:hypothetical protein
MSEAGHPSGSSRAARARSNTQGDAPADRKPLGGDGSFRGAATCYVDVRFGSIRDVGIMRFGLPVNFVGIYIEGNVCNGSF